MGLFAMSSLFRTFGTLVPPSVRELHPFGTQDLCAFVDYTTGMEFHQTPKTYIYFVFWKMPSALHSAFFASISQ